VLRFVIFAELRLLRCPFCSVLPLLIALPSDCAVAAMWWHFFCIGLTDIIFVLRISRFIGVCIEEAPSNNRYLFAYQKKFCIFNPRV